MELAVDYTIAMECCICTGLPDPEKVGELFCPRCRQWCCCKRCYTMHLGGMAVLRKDKNYICIGVPKDGMVSCPANFKD
jgi:hypothetical protein